MEAGIHESAAAGYARAPDAYERGRPGYPEEAIVLLAAELGLRPGARVVDLAAGTGKLTRALAALGADVVAVEPVAEMRDVLAAALPSVTALAGTAEAIPLEDASVARWSSARRSTGSGATRHWRRSTACCARAAGSGSSGTSVTRPCRGSRS